MTNQNRKNRNHSKRQIGEYKLIGLLFISYYSMIGLLIILGLRRRQYDKINLLRNSTININETENTFKVSKHFKILILIQLLWDRIKTIQWQNIRVTLVQPKFSLYIHRFMFASIILCNDLKANCFDWCPCHVDY